MHREAVAAIVADIRLRATQGYKPAGSAHSTEVLEDCILEIVDGPGTPQADFERYHQLRAAGHDEPWVMEKLALTASRTSAPAAPQGTEPDAWLVEGQAIVTGAWASPTLAEDVRQAFERSGATVTPLYRPARSSPSVAVSEEASEAIINPELIAGLLSTMDFTPAEYHPRSCMPMARKILRIMARVSPRTEEER